MKTRRWTLGLIGLAVVGAGGAVLLARQRVELVRGPYLQNVSTTGVTFCWHAEPDAPASIAVRGEGVRLRRRVPPAGSPVLTRQFPVSGLSPGQRYEYVFRVGWLAKVTGTFQTAPAADQPCRFVHWGDTQSNPDVSGQIAEQVLKADVRMTIHSGDFAKTGRDVRQWQREFFEPCASMMREVVLFGAVGNHELTGSPDLPDGYQLYCDLLCLPGNERYYSFDYGMVHFVVLDSNGHHRLGDAQYLWAEQDLLNADAPWKVVVFHHPIYTSGAHASKLDMRATYAPLLARADVDLIVSGHDHNYQLTRPILHLDEPAQKHPYVQLVSGGAGGGLYSVRNDRPWSYRGSAIHHWVLVEVDGERMVGTVFRPDGSEFDRFEIRKHQPFTEPVAYEWIGQLRHLAAAPALGENQQPLRAYFEALQEPLIVFVPLINVLPSPVTVRLLLDDAPHWDVEPGQEQYALPAARPDQPHPPVMATLTIRPRSEECFRPRPRLKLQGESSFGEREVLGKVLQVTLRRKADVLPAQGTVQVDGVLNEPLWEQAASLSPFVFAGAGNEFEVSDTEATRVSVCYDTSGVLLGVRAESPAVEPEIGEGIQQSDHVRVLLASELAEAEVRIDPLNRKHTSPEQVKAASRQRVGGWELEIRVPWPALRLTAPPIEGPPLYLNIARQEGEETTVWSPTFGSSLSRLNAGRLIIR